MSTCHRRKAGRKRCRVGMMSLATSRDITRHHAAPCDRERKRVGSGWRKTSFIRRRCGRETRWRVQKRKAGGSRKWKRKTSRCRKRKGFPLHDPLSPLASRVPSQAMSSARSSPAKTLTFKLPALTQSPAKPGSLIPSVISSSACAQMDVQHEIGMLYG